jgi:hypothetical protein
MSDPLIFNLQTSPIPQTSFLVGTFLTTSYSKDGSNIMCFRHCFYEIFLIFFRVRRKYIWNLLSVCRTIFFGLRAKPGPKFVPWAFKLSRWTWNADKNSKMQLESTGWLTLCIFWVISIRCGRVMTDNIAYAKFRKSLLIW